MQNRNTLIIVLAVAAVALLTIGLIAAPNLTTSESEQAQSTRVDAPFTSVETGDDKTRVRAPFVDVEVPKDKKEPDKPAN
jgi:hypothetical protein